MLGDFINHCENSLTAAVFSHLLHLPGELWWQLLRGACYSAELPAVAGELHSVDFRPKWDPDGTDNVSYVEPDLFLRFAEFDLIIEAKRWDQSQQDPKQWQKEVRAYWHEYMAEETTPNIGRKLRLIALGGVWTTEDQEASVQVPRAATRQANGADGARGASFSCPVHMARWGRLLGECKRMARELEQARYRSSQTRAHERILSHLIGLFAAHGFQTGRWFDEIVPELPSFGPSLALARAAFQTLSKELSRA